MFSLKFSFLIKVVYNLEGLSHFSNSSYFGLGDISTFSTQKIREEKFWKFIKILNYINSSLYSSNQVCSCSLLVGPSRTDEPCEGRSRCPQNEYVMLCYEYAQ